MELDKLTYNSNRRQISIALNNFLLTVHRQPSAQPPSRSLPSKKNLNRFFMDSHFGRDNVTLTILSALVIVCRPTV